MGLVVSVAFACVLVLCALIAAGLLVAVWFERPQDARRIRREATLHRRAQALANHLAKTFKLHVVSVEGDRFTLALLLPEGTEQAERR
jgi:hypothetical protein